ncbi:hypothetical protein [Pseudobacteriovorax antillogorgiicola]|uniref:Uncharacterized protein n=1 Tax=Pseudobacteriovorax antillogorgiicola TaxID=1513793 RepID=A0A1Y6CC48_9BACT|nr:hypothetical protein [Pseudobacteriovorax antillogorgiicola]TCS48623.1 hypothetical protein EDD56_11745 [Pseudobacteriovorax antillogorgiicola]SMF55420.1 hypothetical protein SAMN06296036_117114 [Pseudobacteriovorax antillogorgiicola]
MTTKVSKVYSIDQASRHLGLSEADIWQKVECGQLICRMVHGQLMVYPSESEEPNINSQPQLITSGATGAQDETLRRLASIENTLAGALSSTANQREIDHLNRAVVEKDDEIKRLKHDLEDLSILANTLQSSLES